MVEAEAVFLRGGQAIFTREFSTARCSVEGVIRGLDHLYSFEDFGHGKSRLAWTPLARS